MSHVPRLVLPARPFVIAAALCVALVAGCGKKIEALPTPAVAVMPSEPPSPVDASKPDLPTPPAPPVVGSAGAVTIVLPAPVTNVEGRGTVSVISGTAPATPPSVDTTSPPAAPLTAGLPPTRSASLPGATTIGPASAPPSDQPLSVSPGTTK